MNYFRSKKKFKEEDFVFINLSHFSGKRFDCMGQITQFGGKEENSTMFIRTIKGENLVVKWKSNLTNAIELVNSRLADAIPN